jgi:aspartate/methionine/tyrosine aminotransferase
MMQTVYIKRLMLSRSVASLAPISSVSLARASFSSNAKKDAINIRKQLWEFYLSTGRGANALFEAIDLDEKGTVDPNNLKKFMEEVLPKDVEPKEIMPYAWNRLEQRAAAGQEYDTRAFKKWLVAATKMSADMKGSRLFGLYSHDPQGLGADESEQEEQERTYTWNEETMSQSLRRMQYAVRGEVVMKADQLAAQGREILYTNIGNPHQVGQKPITYYRQVLSLCDLPAEHGVDHPKVYEMYPKDVVERARLYRGIIGESGTGAYTHSQGILGLRRHISAFIEKRDGYPSKPGNIFLTNGASSAIAMVLQGILANNNDAVMIPIPQYPIYSALIAKLGGRQVGYELDESLNWAVTREELESKLEKAKKEDLEVKALAMINPGNPSGSVMTHCDIQVVTEFCSEHGIVLLADEVYQANVYAEGAEFVSAKKVALDSGHRDLQLVSFHSTSKGCVEKA